MFQSHVVASWGFNGDGDLGDSTTGVTKISAGRMFNLALRSDGTVWSWGQNDHGQLGNGATVSTMTPVKVAVLEFK